MGFRCCFLSLQHCFISKTAPGPMAYKKINLVSQLRTKSSPFINFCLPSKSSNSLFYTSRCHAESQIKPRLCSLASSYWKDLIVRFYLFGVMSLCKQAELRPPLVAIRPCFPAPYEVMFHKVSRQPTLIV